MFICGRSYGQTPVAYPLHQGDNWFTYSWEYDESFFRYVAGDTTLTNGKTYAVVVDPVFPYIPRFQRQSADTIFAYGLLGQNSEMILFNFAASVGDTISTILHGNDTAYITMTLNSSDSVFGRSRKQWGFKLDPVPRAIDDEIGYFVVDSLGVLGSGGFGWSEDILGAIIDSIQYGSLTGIKKTKNEPPDHFSLFQNYPNPFNPTTTITFTLPKASFVKIEIVDLLGRHLSDLVEERLSAGTYSKVWNARDFPSGIYFYRFTTQGFSQTRKLLLLK